MVDFLNDDVTYQGEVTFEAEAIVNGGLTVGPGGVRYGEPASEVTGSWPVHTRVRVADETERAQVVAWRNANAPITALNPLLIWRANGSSTGLQEVSTDGVNWYAESAMAGDVEMTLAPVAPYGWALLQGQLLSDASTNYPALWSNAAAVLRQGPNLRLPDFRGRVPMSAGQGAGLTLRNFGDILGAELATLTVANLPAHHHNGTTFGTDRSLNHKHYTRFGHVLGGNPAGSGYTFEVNDLDGGLRHDTTNVYETTDPETQNDLNHKHTFISEDTGSGTGHTNVQPSVVVNFKVKL